MAAISSEDLPGLCCAAGEVVTAAAEVVPLDAPKLVVAVGILDDEIEGEALVVGLVALREVGVDPAFERDSTSDDGVVAAADNGVVEDELGTDVWSGLVEDELGTGTDVGSDSALLGGPSEAGDELLVAGSERSSVPPVEGVVAVVVVSLEVLGGGEAAEAGGNSSVADSAEGEFKSGSERIGFINISPGVEVIGFVAVGELGGDSACGVELSSAVF